MPFDANTMSRAFPQGARMGNRKVPLERTALRVRTHGALASVEVERTFRNDGERPMEATLTFPVPPTSVVYRLEAVIAGRRIVGEAKPNVAARAVYEDGMERGKASFLHERLAAGIHMLSLGQVAPGAEVTVTVVWASPLTALPTGAGRLVVPTTIGDIYGVSPMQDSDTPTHGSFIHAATLDVTTHGTWMLHGKTASGETPVTLDGPIVLEFPQMEWNKAVSSTLDGRRMNLVATPNPAGTLPVRGTVLLDYSGSMAGQARSGDPVTKHQVALSGLRLGAESLLPEDMVTLWQYNDAPNKVSHSKPPRATFITALAATAIPIGGTRTGFAISKVLQSDAEGDLVVVTDGNSHDVDVPALVAEARGRRIHAVFIGEDALNGYLSELVRLTHGEEFTALASSEEAVMMALGAMRRGTLSAPEMRDGLPVRVCTHVGNVLFDYTWEDAPTAAKPKGTRKSKAKSATSDLDRAAMALAVYAALPRMTAENGSELAARAGIVSHLTSLVMVDEAGEVHEGMAETRKVELSTPRNLRGVSAMMACSASGGMAHAFYASSALDAAHSLHKSMPPVGGSGTWMSKDLSRPGATLHPGLSGGIIAPSPLSSEIGLPGHPVWDPTSRMGGGWPNTILPPATLSMPSGIVQPPPVYTLQDLSKMLNWDTDGARLLDEGTDWLPANVRAVAEALITEAIRLEATAKGVTPLMLVLARAAVNATGSRAASRFAARIIGKAKATS